MKEICKRTNTCQYGGFGLLLHAGDKSGDDIECKACEYREALRVQLCGPDGPKGEPSQSDNVTNAMLSGDCEDCDRDPVQCMNKNKCKMYETEESVLCPVDIECGVCKKIFTLEMTKEQYKELLNPKRQRLMQDIFPNMKPHERELLISQVCEKCFDNMFKEDED